MRSQTYILNPHAGRRGGGRSLAERLRRAAPEAEVLQTTRSGEACELASARRKEAGRIVIAVGGDGTVHEVGAGLIGGNAALGVLPTGSGNDFASMIQFPGSIEQAAAFFARTPLRRCDVGRVEWCDGNGGSGQAHFFNSLGLAFEGEVAARAQRLRRVPGRARYLLAVLVELLRFRAPQLDLVIDEHRVSARQFLVAIGNGRRAGGGFVLNPGAEIDDGLLEVCRADALPLFRLLRILPSVFQGHHIRYAGVHQTRCREFQLRAESPTAVHADGEILSRSIRKLRVRVLPRTLLLAG